MNRFLTRSVTLALIALAGCSGGSDPATPATTRAVTVSKSGTADGTITSSPSGISCGATCSAQFQTTAAVTLTAAANPNATFVGWSGACSGTNTTCTIPAASTAASASAQFNLVTFTLTTALAGTGTGSVSSAPAGITCGADCSEAYASGTVVTLTATPAASSTFTGWSGGGCTGTGACVVTVSQAATVTATFTLATNTLTAVVAGTGSGAITSTPLGIACGADCSEVYTSGTVVTLTATPAASSTFTGWSGGCTGTGACVVTMSQATTVTATFTLTTHTLTVARAGNGTGTVTSTPAGINCGVDCTEVYNFGTMVTLTAAAGAGSTFTGWTGVGGCTGTGACTLSIGLAVTVTATFTLNSFTLTTVKAGTGGGTITSTPAGVTCGSTCAPSFASGTVVTLTATPDMSASFAGWSGACTGTGACVVTMNAAATVTATFNFTQANWPDSPTRYCSNLTTGVLCPGGVVGQDGTYAINVPVYEVIGGSVRDPITGFTWQRNPSFTYVSHATALTYCDDLTLDGFTDWRLPTYLELLSVTDFGRIGPPFETVAFPGIPPNSYFWSSTDRGTTTTAAVVINTNYPTSTSFTKAAVSIQFARCVRGTTFSGALTVVGNTVVDGQTGLRWQSGVSPTLLNWSAAISYCEGLVLDAATDWRLPSGKELLSIIDQTRSSPAISTLFTDRPSTSFWSSTPLPNGSAKAYAIHFGTGLSDDIDTDVALTRSVRCVR